jgi:hypothetical protein
MKTSEGDRLGKDRFGKRVCSQFESPSGFCLYYNGERKVCSGMFGRREDLEMNLALT